MKMMFRLVCCLIVCAVFLPSTAFSEGKNKGSDSVPAMDTIVVTAGRVEEKQKDISANVTVLNSETIQQSSAKDLGQLLTEQGFATRMYPGSLTSVGIRGFRTETHGNDLKSHVLVLLDGRRAGTGNISKIMTKNVERVEIIHGPASVQYGSAAMGGIINVITKKGQDTPKAFVEGGLGSWRQEEISAGGSGKVNKIDFSIAGGRATAQDYQTANGETYHNTGFDEKLNLSLNAGYQFTPNHRLGLIYTGFNVDRDGSPSYFSQNDLDDYSDKSNYSYDLVYDGSTSDDFFIWKLRYFNGKDKDKWVDPTDSNPDGWDDGIASERITKNQGAQGQVSADFGHTRATIGVDWVNYDVEATWTPMESEYDNAAGFILGKSILFDERFAVSAGARYDIYEVTVKEGQGTKEDDSHFTPNIGLSYLLTDTLKLRATYGEAFVMPGADQKAADYYIWGSHYVGNPELTPEKSKTIDGGLDFSNAGLFASLTYFYTDFEDKIEPVTRPNGDRSWDNLGSATISGFEGELNFDIGVLNNWDFELRPYGRFSYLTEYKDEDNNENLKYTPEWTASMGITWSGWQGFSSNLNISYSGEQTVTDYENGTYADVRLGSATVANLSISKILVESEKWGVLSLKTDVLNLFNTDYQYVQGYPMPGRSFFVGLRYDI